MPRYDFTSQRLFLDSPLAAGLRVELDRDQTNYLVNVLRKGDGTRLLVFNGRDGEWSASLALQSKRSAVLDVLALERPQTASIDLHYLFAPLKHARLDYMVQKAVEMGAARLVPVMTRHTQATRVNLERMRANVIEAAEQCGILNLPEVSAETAFTPALETLGADRWLVFCDEDAPVRDPIQALRVARAGGDMPTPKLAVLIGPEGGFDSAERELLLRRERVVRLSLGPRILRADTAAVAALALVQAVLGDGAAAV